MKRFRDSLIIIFIISFSLAPLGAGITATYVPDTFVYFTAGSSPFSPYDFVAHLGTLTLTSTDNKLFDPSLVDMTTTAEFEFTGPVLSNGSYSQQPSSAELCAVSKVKNKSTLIQVLGPGNNLINDANGNINTSLFVIDLYLRATPIASSSYHPIDKYLQGELYTITEGILGNFNVATASNGSGNTSNLDYVPVNGQTIPEGGSPPPIPIITNTTIPLPYVDPNNVSPAVQYFLSIINEASFNIEDAFGYKSAQIATAQLILYQAVEGTPYEVNITFNGNSYNDRFSLHQGGDNTLYGIEYTVEFLSQPVTPGALIDWDGLHGGINEETIFVTGIDETEAALAPSGDYSDTITVTITPKDTQ